MPPHIVRRVSVGFLLARLVLIDGGRNHHAAPGVDKVVRHEPSDLADEWDKALLHPPRDLLRIRDALVPTYCCIHNVLLAWHLPLLVESLPAVGCWPAQHQARQGLR